MPSRLSSLLVRDGLVGVKRMEKAFQRQVIYGGSLDTILLEMNLVPEDRLTQYLALASGLPPAGRDERVLDSGATDLVSREVAERYRAVPVAFEGEAVRILVCAPLEMADLEDLADVLDRPLQPLIAPEYRWHLVFAAAYGLDPPARFTTLSRALDVDPTTTPVGRARTVIVDAPEMTPAPVDPQPIQIVTRLSVSSDAETMRVPAMRTPPAPIEHPDPRGRSPTLIGVNPSRVSTDSGSPVARPETPSSRASTPASMSRRRHAPSAPIATEGRDSPIPIVRARELLATAEDRDTVFLTLLRAARSRARWAGLLTVQGGAAIGRVALAEPGLDVAAVSTVLVPLDVLSPFRTVVSNHQPHIGPLISGDPGIDAMLLRLGGTLPPSALVLPVVLRDRVVGLVVAHRVHSDIRLSDVTELLPMATAASDALGRLIVRHKAAGYRAPSSAPIVEIEAEQIETKRIVRIVVDEPFDDPEVAASQEGGRPRRPDSDWRTPEATPSVPSFEQGVEMSLVADLPQGIDDVISTIEAAGPGRAEDAMAEAVERSGETLGALVRRFPGKLRVERFSVTGRPLRAAQYGGLLELVIRLGAVSSELLIDKMSSPKRDIRFYATVCCAELRPRNAIYALAERLFDQDFGVRACAIDALAGYPPHDLEHALGRARRALHSSDPEVVGAAATAIVELGDIEAISDLIGVIERADRGGDHVRKALVALTAQDFGPNERRWRKWYEAAHGRHRVEWLIEGLAHKEDAIREASINELRKLTGEYFGYHYDLPRRERDLATERWVLWWRETGQRRFARIREDERRRPTGQLPARRD